MYLNQFYFKISNVLYFGILTDKTIQILKWYFTSLKINKKITPIKKRTYVIQHAYSILMLLRITYLFIKPQLQNRSFSDAEENKLKKIFNSLPVITDFDVDDKTLAVYWGWVRSKVDVTAFDKNHNEIKPIFRETKLFRNDVSRQKGYKYIKSGFRVYFSSREIERIHHFAYFDSKQKNYFMLNTTSNIDLFLPKKICKICKTDLSIGFIDNVLPKIKISSENQLMDLLFNLILERKFLFRRFYDFAKKSGIYNYFLHHYLKVFDLNQDYTHLIDPDNSQFEQTFKTDSGKSYRWRHLDYSISKSIDSQVISSHDAELFGARILVKNGHLINKFSNFHDKTLVAGEFGQLLLDGKRLRQTKLAVRNNLNQVNLDEAIILPSFVNSNYFHFILENCPNVWFNRLNLGLNTPIVLHEKAPKSFEQILKIIGFSNFYKVNEETLLKIKSVYTFNTSFVLPDALELNLNDFVLNPELLINFRNYILDKVISETKGNLSSPKKLFFLRTSSNKLVTNLRDVIRIAEENDFEIFDPSQISFQEQVRLTNTAEEVMIVGGASMANLLFLNTNTKVYFLTHNGLVNYHLPITLTQLSSSHLTYISGKIDFLNACKSWSLYDVYHANYKINIDFLKTTLSKAHEV
jgi:capsular polysaccharide biosynthesis protein